LAIGHSLTTPDRKRARLAFSPVRRLFDLTQLEAFTMSDSPKFEVVDRRKFKAEEEHEAVKPHAPEPEAARPAAGPRLVEPGPELAGETGAEGIDSEEDLIPMPPPPSAEESTEQKTAYDASAQRVEDLIRAQNPSMGAPETITFDHLVQQLYVSAMIAMGAGTPQGQPARVDIIGARQTIDLLGILAEKTKGNLSDAEDRSLQTVLYEARMGFLEVTRMIALQGMQAPPPPTGKK
jgi:hypothetical protein